MDELWARSKEMPSSIWSTRKRELQVESLSGHGSALEPPKPLSCQTAPEVSLTWSLYATSEAPGKNQSSDKFGKPGGIRYSNRTPSAVSPNGAHR